MRHVFRVLVVGLAVLLIGVPAVTLAQAPSGAPGATGTPGASGSGTTGAPGTPGTPGAPSVGQPSPTAPSATPGTSGSSVDADSKSKLGGQASPGKPANSDACKDSGWQKFGFKSQADCIGSFTAGGKR